MKNDDCGFVYGQVQSLFFTTVSFSTMGRHMDNQTCFVLKFFISISCLCTTITVTRLKLTVTHKTRVDPVGSHNTRDVPDERIPPGTHGGTSDDW